MFALLRRSLPHPIAAARANLYLLAPLQPVSALPTPAASAVSNFAGTAPGDAARSATRAFLPPFLAAWHMLPRAADLMPSLLLTGRGKWAGKNKRIPKKANHGARPCNHVGRRQRQAAAGKFRFRAKP